MATCSECDTAITARNRSGLCKRHLTQKWEREHRPHLAAYMRDYWKTRKQPYDKAKAAADWAAWAASHKEEIKATDAANRALKQKLFVEVVRRDVVWKRDGGRCHLCMRLVDAEWHLDHVIPLALGGPHSYRNVAVAHPWCNLSKHAQARSSDTARWSEALGAYELFHGRAFGMGAP